MKLFFSISKRNCKSDLNSFINNECGCFTEQNKDGVIISIDTVPIFVSFGKTYIRIQDHENDPKILTQLFYDKSLKIGKYTQTIKNVVASSRERKEKEVEKENEKNKYKDFFIKFVNDNKYAYEPYSLDSLDLSNEELFTVVSDGNFHIDAYFDKNKDKLAFAPIINQKIINDLSPVGITNYTEYVNGVDSAMKRIEKLKKVISIIINDIIENNK